MSGVEQFFRWMHILAGVLWIGLLYFFNWVNSAFIPTLDAETKKKVIPELLPRALYWFRWGAAWTWITGVVLLTLVFYHSARGGSEGLLFATGNTWSTGAFVMLAVVFLAVFLYDALFKSGLAKNPKVAVSIGFVLIAVILFLPCGHLAPKQIQNITGFVLAGDIHGCRRRCRGDYTSPYFSLAFLLTSGQ